MPIMSRCANCGNPTELNAEKSDSTTELGAEFVECYDCPHCGVSGRIKGVVGQPAERWNRTGMVFNA